MFGKLYVYDTITVGDQGNGALVLNSGTISAYAIQLGNTVSGTVYSGSLTINGGVVEASVIGIGGGSAGAWTTGGSIAFNAGTHRDVVHMQFADYRRAVEPTILPFGRRVAA